MKFVKSIAAAAALALIPAATLAEEQITLRFQHFVSPKVAVPLYFMKPWAEKVEADSDGRLKVEIYPHMQLGGKAPSLYDQIRDGVVDGGWVIPAYTPGRFPEAEALELPFITTMDASVSSRAAWEYTQKHLADDFEDVHLIAVHVHGPGVVHVKGEPLASAADFEGKKLRGPSRQANELFKAMGATPVGMPVPAFPDALAKGVVDGGGIPWEIVPPLKVHELTDASTQVGGDRALYNLYFLWAMNKDSYAALPDDLKAVIDANSGIDASEWAGEALVTGDAIGMEKVAANGNTIHTMGEAETAEIKEIAEGVTARWIEAMDEKGFDGAALVEDARAMIATEEAKAANATN
ncbi:MAG: TRAP transporter substrate-binding protein [Pseudomonadota bacterium]